MGRYHLVEPLGGGPTGEVYRAKVYGVAGFERQLAVKRFHPSLVADPEVAAKLASAARLYGSLEHPRVARLHEFGVAGDETFTATELVEGADVGQLLDAGSLPRGAAAAIIVQACRAVGHAHGRGLCHLGVCPTNLIVAPTGAVKVTDFGMLPPRLPARPASDASLARRLGYLAPEQLAGEPTSPATDVFQLGLIAYELLLGARPFGGRDAVAIAAAIEDARGIATGSLPKPLAKVLIRALARAPFERFPDAGAMADAIEAAVRTAPVPGSVSHAAAAVQKLRADKLALQTGQTSGAMTFPLPSPPRPGDGDSKRTLDGMPVAAPARKTLMLGDTPMRIPNRPGAANERAPTFGGETSSFGEDTFALDLETDARTTPRAPATSGSSRPSNGAGPLEGDVLELIEDELGPGDGDPAELGRDTLDGLGPTQNPSRPAARARSIPPPIPGARPAPPVPAEPRGDSGARPLAAGAFFDGAGVAPGDGLLETLTEIAPAPEAPPALTPPPAIVAESLRPPRRESRRGPSRALLYGALFAVLAAGSFVGYGVLTDGESAAADAPAGEGATQVAGAEAAAPPGEAAEPAGGGDPGGADPAAEDPAGEVAGGKEPGGQVAAGEVAGGEEPGGQVAAGEVAAGEDPAAAATEPDLADDEPTAGGELVVTTTPPGAKLYLDGTLIGATPQTVEATADRHKIALVLPGHELVTREVDSGGELSIALTEVTPSGGQGGIKVRCRAKNRYYVFIDGDATGQLCPTERIGVKLGAHTVEVYDPVTDSRRVFKVPVKQSRRSVRVRID